MRQLSADAAGHFRVLLLRTSNPAASAFYESLGFTRVADDPTCTGRWPLSAQPAAPTTAGLT